MRLGLDVDGVHANFVGGLQQLTVKTLGKDLFLREDAKNPPCWDWFHLRGYTQEEMDAVWKVIAESRDFWLTLEELPGCRTTRLVIRDLMRWHDVYFITNRLGKDAKWQTEQWLILHLGIERPTVLLSGSKGLCARALKLDCYLDDYHVNANNVVEQTSDTYAVKKPATRTYLLNTSYNEGQTLYPHVRRVNTVGEFYDAELANL